MTPFLQLYTGSTITDLSCSLQVYLSIYLSTISLPPSHKLLMILANWKLASGR